jgi:hypothetical protein
MSPETCDSLDKDSLKQLVVQLLARIDALLARIAELEAKLGQPPKTPTNSSLAPSTGPKANRPETARGKKRRKGRPGVARALCTNPDATRQVYAERCACGAALSAADQPLVFAYDHIDLPPIKPVTTRVHLHKGNCPRCKRRVVAKPPADMPPGSPFGPGIVSLVTYLHTCKMVSYARLTEMLDGLFGLKLSEGAIANMLARAAKPFAAQGGKDRSDRAQQSRRRQRRDVGARCRENPLAVDVPRHDSRVSHHCANARQGRANRVPRRRAAQGVGVGPPAPRPPGGAGIPAGPPRPARPELRVRAALRRERVRQRPAFARPDRCRLPQG